jgi:hypothetical protein
VARSALTIFLYLLSLRAWGEVHKLQRSASGYAIFSDFLPLFLFWVKTIFSAVAAKVVSKADDSPGPVLLLIGIVFSP